MTKTTLKRTIGWSAWGLLLACAGETETSLGTQESSNSAVSTAGNTGPVACAQYVSGGGDQLLDPPRACVSIYSNCSDGHIYELHCDGLGCQCVFDGWPQDSQGTSNFMTPRCPMMQEAAQRCGWPIGLSPGAVFLAGALQGMPCEQGIAEGTDCECVDGLFMCPTVGGCNVVGDYVPRGSALPVVRFLADGTFYASDNTSDATFDDVRRGKASGSYGTWVLNADVLSLRSNHPDGDQSCPKEAGRYAVQFNAACELTELRLLDDPCEARTVLGTQYDPL